MLPFCRALWIASQNEFLVFVFWSQALSLNGSTSIYGKRYNVKALDAMPWTGSIRLLGIPTLYAIARSDAALICDGIIFGKKLFNPTFNYLITLIFLVPWARLFGCKVICYNCGIGPFPGFWSKIFARWVINGSSLVTMREEDSKALAEEIGVTVPMSLTGDSAFINPVSDEARAKEIAEENSINLNAPILGINVTKYIDSWLNSSERVKDKEQFLQDVIDGMNLLRGKLDPDVQYVVFSTQPMDEEVSHKIAKGINAAVIDNSRYLSHDIQAIMAYCGVMIGMRFHSLVLSSAVEVPVVGLVYAPKVRGYMRLLDCEEFSLELSDVTAEHLAETLYKAWSERAELHAKQKLVVDNLKKGAHRAAQELTELCYPALATSGQSVANA